MFYALLRLVVLALSLSPFSATAEPVKLKLTFFSSDRAVLYTGFVKPFVDAVNAEGQGVVEIEVFFGGALGKEPAQQANLVRSGIADIGFITPGYTADKFPDNAVIELPGMFRDQREASLVFLRMVTAGALRGYEDFITINAVTVEPHSIHTRKPISSLADLKGMKIRANNPTEAGTFDRLGMHGTVMEVNRIADAISSGALDGAALPPAMLGEFGVGRLASHHYMLHADAPSMGVFMNRERFEALPPNAQEIIRKYSGEWAVERANAFFEAFNEEELERLKAHGKRHVIFPTAAEQVVIGKAFKTVVEEWAAKSERNQALLAMAQAEIARIRSGQ